jgi:uncharacterized protein YqeY
MIKEKLDSFIKESMLGKNSVKTGVLRDIKTRFMQWETAKNAKPLDEQAVIRRMVADREYSASVYAKASRNDLAEKEYAELAYLLEFKEDDVTEEEIKNAVEAAIVNGSTNLGSVMKFVKQALPGANMKLTSDLAKTLLDELIPK